ncbi:MAG: hypothetical protein IPO36_01570 [Anaerolineales bacterium]|nr:hypothetical protein [Anaerolineales bacterium]
MNFKSIGYILIALSVITCCFSSCLLYYFAPSTPISGNSPQALFLNLFCMAIVAAFILGIGLLIYSKVADGQKRNTQAQLEIQSKREKMENDAKKAEEAKKREDELIDKWIKKKPE